MANVVKIIVQAIDKTKVGLNTPLNSLKNIQLAAKALGPALKVMGVAAGAAFAKFAKNSVMAAEEMRRMNNTMLVATGTMELATQEMGFVGDIANELGLEFKALAKGYAGIAAASKGTALEGEGVRSVFEGVSTAMSALSLSADDTRGVMTALQQIISKGTVSSDELKQQLGERLPGAIQIASRAMGVTTEELSKMLEQGKIVASDFLPKFAKEMKRTFGPAAQEGAKSLTANINRLKNSVFKLMVAAGNELLPEINKLTAAFVDFISKGENGIITVKGIVAAMRLLKEVTIGVMGSFMILGTAIGVSLADAFGSVKKEINRVVLLGDLAASNAKEAFMERTGGVAKVDELKFYYERKKLVDDFNKKNSGEIEVWKAIAEEIERVDKLLSGRDTQTPDTPETPKTTNETVTELAAPSGEPLTKPQLSAFASISKEHDKEFLSERDLLEKTFVLKSDALEKELGQTAVGLDAQKKLQDLFFNDVKELGIKDLEEKREASIAIADLQIEADEAERERLTALSELKFELGLAGLDAETEQAEIARQLRNQQYEEDVARIKALEMTKLESDELIASAEKARANQARADAIAAAKKADDIQKHRENVFQNSLGNMASASAAFFGEQSGAYKAFAISEAIVNTYRGANQTLADPLLPYWMKAFAVTSIIASGLANVAQISGVAHGGLTEVPSDQTFLLKQGERVLSPDQNEDFTEFIGGGGGGGGNGMIDLTINIDGQPLYSGISKASRDGRFTISARAVA
tara:strand:- start:1628 stop:3892 length:2265 start_codon:yes stop_codon:yes gene_type:complete